MYVSVRFPKYLALCLGFMVVVVCVSPAHAPVANPPGLQLLDEGTTQGQTVFLDCVGDGIACSVSGTTGTVSVGAGPGSGDITAVGDDTTGAAFTATAGDDGSTLWFEGSTVDGNEVAVTTADPTSDVTITIPAVTDTLVGRATTDTLTNKTIDATNTVTINASDITDLNAGTDLTADLEEELVNSAGLAATLSDETGTGLACFATSPTFTTSILIGSAGVKLSDDGDGAITLLGEGDGFDEDLTINLDDTANTAMVTSSTGLTDLVFTEIWPIVKSSSSPGFFAHDTDTVDDDASMGLFVNCTTLGSGVEDCDVTLRVQVNGSVLNFLVMDGDSDDGGAGTDNALTLGASAVNVIYLITDGGIITVDGGITTVGTNVIGDGSSTVTVNATTGIPMTTTATECVMLDAAGITCLGTNGCTDPADIDGTNFSFKTAAFATGADDLGSWVFELPDNLSGTTASVTFIWFSDNAACNNGADDDVCWTIDGGSFADDAAFETGALGGTEKGVTDRCTADGDIMRTAAITFTHGMTAGQTAAVLVRRDTDETIADCAAGTDDYAQDAKLRAVKFCYEVDNVFSDE